MTIKDPSPKKKPVDVKFVALHKDSNVVCSFCGQSTNVGLMVMGGQETFHVECLYNDYRRVKALLDRHEKPQNYALM